MEESDDSNVSRRIEDDPNISVVLTLVAQFQPDWESRIRRIVRSSKGKPVLLVMAKCSRDLIRSAVQAGVLGVLPLTASREQYSRAIQAVSCGEPFRPWNGASHEEFERLNGSACDCIEEPADEGPKLTRRQRDVLDLIASGYSNAQIAHELGMSENTVRIHVSAILKTLAVPNRTSAALWARGLGQYLNEDCMPKARAGA